MLRTKNFFAVAAFAALAGLCLPSHAQAHGFAFLALSGNNNGCNGGGGNNNHNDNGCHNGHHGSHCNHKNHGNCNHNNHGCNGGNNNLDCDAGGPYRVECGPGPLTVELDATDSTGATTFHWSTNFPGAVFEDANAAETTLTFTPNNNGNCCGSEFYVNLTVGNGTRTKSCYAEVKVKDTTPPVLVCPPLAKIICGMDESPDANGRPEVFDACDPNPVVTYKDTLVFQDCKAERLDHNINRLWKAKDRCGNVVTCLQEIHVVKVVVAVDALPGRCPNVVDFNDCQPVKFAILGSATLDVRDISLNSVRLYGEHCDGGPIVPLCTYRQDVGTPAPVDLSVCECSDANGDGILDLVATFRRSNVIQGLGLCDLPSGSLKRVVLVGKLECNGCKVIGTDCIQVP